MTWLQTQTTTDPFLLHLHSLLTYSHANRAVLKLRDQKQLDFEELSDYLSGVTVERDRLAAIISGHAGSTGLGIGAYIRDRVDSIRGADDDRSRVEKMKKLDVKIKEVGSTGDLLIWILISLLCSCKTPLPPPTKHQMLLVTKHFGNKRSSSTPKNPK